VGSQGLAGLERCSAQRPRLGTELELDLDLSGHRGLGRDAGQGYGWGEGTKGSLRCSTQRVLQQENNTYSRGATENQENKV